MSLLQRGCNLSTYGHFTSAGDGGIDGRVYKKEKRYFVQAKRYSGYVSRQHIEDFSSLCKKNKHQGLFVHTGKTGKQSLITGKDIELISGQRLIDLLSA